MLNEAERAALEVEVGYEVRGKAAGPSTPQWIYLPDTTEGGVPGRPYERPGVPPPA